MFKILVVEDDKDLNQTVCAYLNKNGYEAIGCLSANDAYNEMYGTLLQSPELSEEQRIQYGKAIQEQTKRLSNLVMNILKLNKLENQQIYPNVEKYDLGEQLCECMLEFESVWEEKNIEIDVDIQEEVQIQADKELLSLVWNNFYQGDTSHATKGNGLGLALVKRVIDICGGEISVSSQLGEGSTFTVKLWRNTNGEILA